jgi:phage anti-repressor protein
MAIQLKNQVEEILKKSNYARLTEHELAKYVGFNNEEIKMLILYWDAVFNESLIYLSDELILNNLTNEVKKNAISNFITRILITNFKNPDDYQKLDSNHELVTKFCSSNLRSKNHNTQGGSNKQYYGVTGECWKKLLMMSKSKNGDKIRNYYIKVEKLAKTMFIYIMELEKHIAQKQIEAQKLLLNQSNEKMREITKEKEEITKEKEEIIKKKEKELQQITQSPIVNIAKTLIQIEKDKDEFYVISNHTNIKKSIYSFGKAIHSTRRLTQHNKSHVEKLFIIKKFKCFNAYQVESRIKNLLVKFVRGENIVMPIRLLLELVELIINHIDDETDYVNDVINVFLIDFQNFNESDDEYLKKEGLLKEFNDPWIVEKKKSDTPIVVKNEIEEPKESLSEDEDIQENKKEDSKDLSNEDSDSDSESDEDENEDEDNDEDEDSDEDESLTKDEKIAKLKAQVDKIATLTYSTIKSMCEQLNLIFDEIKPYFKKYRSGNHFYWKLVG